MSQSNVVNRLNSVVQALSGAYINVANYDGGKFFFILITVWVVLKKEGDVSTNFQLIGFVRPKDALPSTYRFILILKLILVKQILVAVFLRSALFYIWFYLCCYHLRKLICDYCLD